ncbi:histidine kinase osmosensor Osmolarity two-component system protein SLN1 [Scheffersomyces stipitis CBS 6054]|uniref:histidine kinase n=1 Tax=Scheffersomyces stipitis (strain ATCC 58785 / CBS 6054 / NBRC 10063 / NRRL Y-11545) TaxID=322104 RepID=A3LXS9_PICST|nr:histidine kinase osmosensor Osmolarity two-component system protein SLN1 [Scheffersomyces stipitis CBS 6054]ABN67852.2 histidine kinase osmosensor Osmolarity two-component system protein SLN1 [Scheffersomyces stipitis CBS 6054]
MRRLKIGIRPQLIILVGFASLFSLLILAIVTAVYFSSNLSDLRAERLEVISQLKTTQVRQAVEYIYYQVYWLTTKDSIYAPLSSYRAGNITTSIFSEAQNTLDQFLISSELFAAARLYNLNLEIVAESYNNATSISQPAMDFLYPLAQNATIPQSLLQQSSNNVEPYFTGPIGNSTDPNSAFYMGITLPIYSNSSIILDDPSLSGYLTVIASAQSIQAAINDTTGFSNNSSADYIVIALHGATTFNSDETGQVIGFQTVFPVKDNILSPNNVYNINDSSSVKEAFSRTYGSATNVRSITGKYVAIGFNQILLDSTTRWAVIIEQARSKFLQPVNNLRKIIIGVVIGIGVFMCLITFPLAVFFIRPITKLKEATEAITKSKKQFKQQKDRDSSAASPIPSSNPPPPYTTLNHRHKRNSVKSTSNTSTSGSLYSTAIRLPGRIPNSKKFFKDEFTELSEAFNIMTEELDKQYTHLEDRVKLRTKELEASKIEAESANEAKTVFIANISHELRTPLNGILGMTSIAMDEEDQTRIQDSLKLIHRSGELLLHILTELLTYSKNTLNRSKLEKSNFQILEVVYQVKSIFSKLAMDQRVNFKIWVRPNIFRKLILYGDSNRIIQVVMNLVSNSLKFTPIDGSVEVTFKLLGEYDKERSQQDGYKQVHVLKGTKTSPNSSTSNEATGMAKSTSSSTLAIMSSYYKTKPIPKIGKPTPALPEERSNDIELSPVKSNSSDSTDLSKNLDSDRVSLSTISTTEYENKIFESQFNHMKALPKLPVTFRIRNMYKPKTWVVQIEVRDTGPGIEPALQEKVFEPFVQGDQTLSRSYGGTGLGLSICRQLATMMKGTLTLKSAIGVGSIFTFTVPLPQTGEILVDESEMGEFCEDEFNPKARVNRKVAFKNSTMDVDNPTHHEYENDELSEKDDFVEMSPLRPQPPPSRVRTDSVPRSDSSGDSPRQENSDSPGSSGSFQLLGKVDPPRTTYEKPHLITRSSTGTANSANASDRSDLHHNILDDLSDLKILVAEDNSVNQEVIKRMLKLEGFTNITLACNGAEAVELTKESIEKDEIFDLIFMDVQMPKIDGLLATRMIRTNLRFENPIIALTAFADESNVKECLNSGMSGFLSKPIRRTNLRKIIVEFSPVLLSEIVTTPQTHQSDEKRLGYPPTNLGSSA